jgi:hypothetical protein
MSGKCSLSHDKWSKLIKQIKCWDRMKPNAFPKMMCRILDVDVPTATVLNLLVDCLESLAEDEEGVSGHAE